MDIAPKPTEYRKVLFASRLEAQWAMFFDSYSLCREWTYQPATILNTEKGWQYTPDFLVHTSLESFYIEVKPYLPNQEYLKDLAIASIGVEAHKVQLKLGFGTFFRTEPKIATISPKMEHFKRIQLKSSKLSISNEFPSSTKSVKIVQGIRFDKPLSNLR